jgi:nucleotide-binding universal stress UspA family protein
MKILIAVDGSPFTKKMLAYLVTHESMFSTAHDYAVFTARMSLPARATSVVGKTVVDDYHREEAEKILAPTVKFLLRHGINAKSDWKAGPIGMTIAQFAEKGKFDLVVMGSHGHGALTNLVMGSVATQVLAHCKVPVLMVR